MCPNFYTQTVGVSKPLYMMSPKFYVKNGHYWPKTWCRCVAQTSGTARIHVKILAANLKESSDCDRDWMQFNNNGKSYTLM